MEEAVLRGDKALGEEGVVPRRRLRRPARSGRSEEQAGAKSRPERRAGRNEEQAGAKSRPEQRAGRSEEQAARSGAGAKMRSTGGEARTLMCGTPNPSRTIVTWPSSAAACREEVTSGSAASRSLAESTMFGDRAFQGPQPKARRKQLNNKAKKQRYRSRRKAVAFSSISVLLASSS